jgi:ribosome maturation factor RimP
VKIETAVPLEGRRRFHGYISQEGPDGVRLTLKDGGEVVLPVSEMVKAHLVLTDRLIEEARARGGAPAADLTDDGNGADFDAVEVEDDSEDDAGGEDGFADDDEDEEDERNH